MAIAGIVRKIDNLGRLVLPIEIRRILKISNKDDIEILIDGSFVMLRKYIEPECKCVFCGESEVLSDFKGKKICSDCLKLLENN